MTKDYDMKSTDTASGLADQNKTHGVLKDDALRAEAKELSAILAGMGEGGYELETFYTSDQTDGDAFVRRAADMLAVFAAPQSPGAPADERAAFEAFRLSKDQYAHLGRMGLVNNDEYTNAEEQAAWESWQARARLADAPNTCVCGHSSTLGVVHRTDGPCFVYATGEAPTVSATNQHPDDDAVDRFAEALKEKLAQARKKGRSGWHECDPLDLSTMLRLHVEKGDPRDVANFCMFLWSLGQPISPILGLADHIESLRRISERASNAAPTPPTSAADIFSPYSYQKLFDAIAAATNAQDGGAVNVSVEKFRAAIAGSKKESRDA